MGIDAPASLLHCKGSNPDLYLDRTATSQRAGISFTTNGGETDGSWAIRMNNSGTSATPSLSFHKFTGTDAQVMTLTDAGNVGIGDTDPSEAKLSITGVASGDYGLKIDQDQDMPAIYIDSEGANENAIEMYAKMGIYAAVDISGGRAAFFDRNLGEAGTHPLVTIRDNHTSNQQPALQIQQDGGVAALKIVASGSHVLFDTPGASQNAWLTWADNGTNKWEINKSTAQDFTVYSYTLGSHVITMKETGAVGIGTTTPSSLSYAAASPTVLQIQGAAAQLNLHATGTGSPFWEIAAYDQKLRISDDGYDRIAIDSSGKVGIGTHSPTRGFQLKGASASNMCEVSYINTSNSDAEWRIGPGIGTSVDLFTFYKSGIRMTIKEDTGAVWIDGNMSAASITDRTPYPETLQLAYDVINSHKRLPENEYKADDISKQLNHTDLHEYVSTTTPATLWTENDDLPEGVSVGDVNKEEEKGRNMSGVISCLVEVVKDLSTKVTALENA